jgi:hypothetical protein
MPTVPFEAPKFSSAKRILGFVDIPENKHAAESALDWGNRSFGPGAGVFALNADVDDANTNLDDKDEKLAGPTHLKRTSTLAGNILVIENEGSEAHAFWLQRKVGHTAHGSIRLGFVLLSSSTSEGKVWSLASGGDEGDDEAGMNYQMVAIKILNTSVLDSDHTDELHNPISELSALQMIADHYEKTGMQPQGGHVIATKLVAVSSQNVYAILPYYPDGTLFQYCLAQGSLKETVARFFFQQILKVRRDLFLE